MENTERVVKLLELADLLEEGEGLDIPLDESVALAAGWVKDESYNPDLWISPKDQKAKVTWDSWVATIEAPSFSESTDAAFLLVPDLWVHSHTQRFDGTTLACCQPRGDIRAKLNLTEQKGESKSTSRAIAAAALRAQADALKQESPPDLGCLPPQFGIFEDGQRKEG